MFRILGRLVAVAGLAVAFAASAQPGMPPSSPPPGYTAPAPPTPAAQSDRLRQSLRLRPDQEGALQAFVAVMQPRLGEVERLREAARREALLPTPQRLDAMMARMDEMRAQVIARVRATKAFYSQLTAEQQRAFDALPPPPRS
jgi:hypothetical protein